MKKFKLLSFIIWALILVACSGKKQEQTSVYSFHGENECIAVLNGSITMNSGEEVFDGGNLSVIKTELFDEIVSYTATFYTLEDEAQRTLMSNSVVDFTGGMIHVEEDLGQMSGDGFIIGGKVESIDELQENLWFELKTTDLNGEEEVYKIQLTLSEQTKLDN